MNAREVIAEELARDGVARKYPKDRAADIIAALHAAGLAIVPVEPDAEMVAAGKIPTHRIDLGNGTTATGLGLGADPRWIYRAMVQSHIRRTSLSAIQKIGQEIEGE